MQALNYKRTYNGIITPSHFINLPISQYLGMMSNAKPRSRFVKELRNASTLVGSVMVRLIAPTVGTS